MAAGAARVDVAAGRVVLTIATADQSAAIHFSTLDKAREVRDGLDDAIARLEGRAVSQAALAVEAARGKS